jgi:hypothetical protein
MRKTQKGGKESSRKERARKENETMTKMCVIDRKKKKKTERMCVRYRERLSE